MQGMTTARVPEMEADVLEALDAIRPALQADGGDIVFKELDDDGVVHVELVGACGTCPVSTKRLSTAGCVVSA
jgi:Fe-S cluster biogenesis protein NfuA